MSPDLSTRVRSYATQLERDVPHVTVAEIEQRLTNSTVEPETDAHRQIPGWAVAIAAAAVVLVIVGVLPWLLRSPGVGEPSAPSPSTPVSTPEATQPETPPTTAPPTTLATSPATSVPPEPITIDELHAVFDDPAMWTEELRDSYLVGSFQGYVERDGHVFDGLEIGSRIDFEAELLDGGEFSTEEFAGGPALVVAWYGEPDSLELGGGWAQVHQNLGALQSVYESFGDRLGVVSIFIPYGSLPGMAEAREEGLEAPDLPDEAFLPAISEQLARNGYTFPVVIDPTRPDGAPMTAWADFGDGMPVWVLVDASGRVIDGFLGYIAPIPVAFLLAELEGEEITIERTVADWWKTPAETDDLASNCAQGIVAAGDGALWVTGPCGVARFDGAAWTTYPEGTDAAAAVGPDGSVWFASGSTVLHFDRDVWSTIEAPRIITGVAVTADGTVWASQGDTLLWSFDRATWVSHPAATPEGMAGLIAAAPDGSLWAGMEDQLVRYDGAAWTVVSGPDRPEGLGPGAFDFSPDGDLWLTDIVLGGLLHYDGELWTSHISGVPIDAVAFAPDGTVWASSSDQGAFRYDGSTWTNYRQADGLESDDLNDVAVTPGGDVWFATRDGRAFRFHPEG